MNCPSLLDKYYFLYYNILIFRYKGGESQWPKTRHKKDDTKTHFAYKFRMFPTSEQANLINRTFGCARLIYNSLLHDKQDYYAATGLTLKKEVSEYKKDKPFLKEVDSLALANAKMNLEQAYDNFFNGRAKLPKNHKKGKHDTYTTNAINGNIAVNDDGIKLPKLGVVKTKLHRAIRTDAVIKSCTISRKAGKYYVSVLVEVVKDDTPPVKITTSTKALGFDYSSPDFYVDSEGNKAGYPKYYYQGQKKLAKEQRKLSRCEYRSHNYYRQLVRVQRIQEHIANQRKDFINKKVHELVEHSDFAVFCFEDLNLNTTKRTLKFGKATSDNGFGMFRTKLEHKAIEYGKHFIKVDKFFPSSQLCHCCGYKNTATKGIKGLKVREWECPVCGTRHDGDVNAAINIRDEGLKLLLQAQDVMAAEITRAKSS